ncbi:MAG: hypothetical protein K8I30_12660 [Anaerolineae bacterium]|nr:hypothetical protein [Anaerolineae bacterium]
MDQATVLAAIDTAFGGLSRPAVMLRNPTHCDECIEHEATMQAVTPGTVSLQEIGNPGWDPVCYIADETFMYFMPGFARLALEADDHYAYLDQLFFHLGHTDRVAAMNPDQRRAIAQLMDFLEDNLLDVIVNNGLDIDFDHVKASLAANQG